MDLTLGILFSNARGIEVKTFIENQSEIISAKIIIDTRIKAFYDLGTVDILLYKNSNTVLFPITNELK